ncbi:MAG TPA: 50S ribosomal protein L18 [Methanomicrobia archaeon]|nr:50S ribosomal protein L18 [Methanomicrobia archaeon]
MARGPTYRVPFRRRREGKTDYRKRLKLLLSGKPRVVVRKSNKHIRVQLVLGGRDKLGDRTVADAVSSELKKFDYKGGESNTPAAYLTGLLLGRKAREGGFDEAILDLGLQTPTHGSKVYAALKGVTDAGMLLLHDSAVFPTDERVRGEHISGFSQDNFKEVSEKIMRTRKE